MPKPTANTFFANSSTARKAQIQATLDAITAGASRDKILCDLNALTSQMSAADRDQLVSLAYQQLAGR